MARLSKLKRIPRKKRTRQKNQRLLNQERFSLKNNNKSKISKEAIEKCNKILVENNKDCNCFTDKKKLIPDENMFDCISRNNSSKCSDYNKCKILFGSFMSGSEPNYNPDDWSNPIIEGSHNCYAYFLNDKIPRTKKKM